MKTTLIRSYQSGEVIKLFTLDINSMDEYIITNFGNKAEMEQYFSNMKKVIMDDGNADYGEFKLIAVEDKEKEKYFELPILYGSDYERLVEELNNGLLYDKDFLSNLYTQAPELLPGSLKERMIVSLQGLTLPSIHSRNVKTLLNSLIDGGLKSNFRKVYNIRYSETKSEDNYEKPKLRVLY